MHTLVPFYKEKNQFELKSAFIMHDQNLQLIFKWEPKHTGIDMALNTHGKIGKRTHELWQKTCFEAFVQIDNSDLYYEINLSSLGEWNVYRFNGCRQPQPPQEWDGAELLEFKFEPGHLMATIRFPIESNHKLRVGLTAVIDYIDGRKNYFSLKHESSKPDFHDFKTFLIERYS